MSLATSMNDALIALTKIVKSNARALDKRVRVDAKQALSTAEQQQALDNIGLSNINGGVDGQYFDGSKTWKNLPASSGLTNLSEVFSNTTPNNNTPAIGIAPATNRQEANIDLVLSQKGNGALVMQIPDGTATGGNKRGAYAVDLQIQRQNQTQVASGNYSFASGYRNTANGTSSTALGEANNVNGSYAACIGFNNTASGLASFCLGNGNTCNSQQSFATGVSNTCSGTSSAAIGEGNLTSFHYSIAIGRFAKTRALYSLAIGADNNYQTQIVPISRSTSTSANLSYPALTNSLRHIRAYVIAKSDDNTAFASWEFSAVMTCGATISTNSFLGNPVISQANTTSNASSWTCTVNADIGGFKVFIDPKGTPSKWLATLYVQEIY